MSLTLSNKTIDKYLGFLARFDNVSKKKLINKLAESIDTKKESEFELKDLYGAWEDSRDSDEIIKEIRDSRIDNDKNNTEKGAAVYAVFLFFPSLIKNTNIS
ncbi:MAG: hypothetical protein JEY97_15135 [Bacteroidales bacterium]|nr:hypothetical protein [Bacteroidales bacterium]